jgi:hypothetical protein
MQNQWRSLALSEEPSDVARFPQQVDIGTMGAASTAAMTPERRRRR